jgi:hypothetical protein
MRVENIKIWAEAVMPACNPSCGEAEISSAGITEVLEQKGLREGLNRRET